MDSKKKGNLMIGLFPHFLSKVKISLVGENETRMRKEICKFYGKQSSQISSNFTLVKSLTVVGGHVV